MKRIKVLHIINNLGSGGAEKLLSDMIVAMKTNDYVTNHLLILNDRGNVFDNKLTENEVDIDILTSGNIRNPINVLKIKRYIVDGGFDIVHAHLFPTLYLVSLASKLIVNEKPVFMYTEHSTNNRRRRTKFLKPIERYIYSSYNKIVSISKDTQKKLVSWLGNKYTNDRFTVIENGVDIGYFADTVGYNKSFINKEFTDESFLLCMIGRFTKAKDQSTIINAMTRLPASIHLLLVGEGPLIEENKKLAKAMDVDQRVHFLGYRSDINQILKTIDVMVHSSKWEGFGLAVVEAMAAGKPVIASDVPGLNSIVDGYGLLFKQGNVIDLTEKINKVFRDVEFYERLANKSISRSKKYGLMNMIDKYVQLYSKLLKGE